MLTAPNLAGDARVEAQGVGAAAVEAVLPKRQGFEVRAQKPNPRAIVKRQGPRDTSGIRMNHISNFMTTLAKTRVVSSWSRHLPKNQCQTSTVKKKVPIAQS